MNVIEDTLSSTALFTSTMFTDVMQNVFSQLYALVGCVLNKLMSFAGLQVGLEAIQMANGQIIRAVRVTLGSGLPVPMHG